MTEKVDIMIPNEMILTVDQERRVIRDGAIVIEKDRIKDLGKSDELKKRMEELHPT
jgi:cytosine/adenosine deaminase-related metal-dependent hydrolase